MLEKLRNNIAHLVRSKKGLTQNGLGVEIGVGKNIVSNWITGVSKPNVIQLIKIADYFEINLDHLIRLDVEIEKTPRKEDIIIKVGESEQLGVAMETSESYINYKELYEMQHDYIGTLKINVTYLEKDLETTQRLLEACKKNNRTIPAQK